MKTICLNMIVKNETRIITRLLDSINPIFDTFCICDTGSDDGTPEIIEKWMSENNKKGFLIHEPFRNFGYNRTHCIMEAKKYISNGTLEGDYFLLLDADMKLVFSEKFNKELLQANAYSIIQKSPALNYYNVRFIKTSCQTTSMGVTHEYYDIQEGGVEKLDETFIYIDDIGDGGAKGNKAVRDLALLTGGINDTSTPDGLRSRYYFYRANTYFDTYQDDKAIDDYKTRIKMGGWVEEVWYSKYRIGQIFCRKGNFDQAAIAFLEAYQHYPKRAESLYELVKIYRIRGLQNVAYMFYNTAKQIPYPKDDVLFINRNVYEFLLDYELSIIGYYVNHPGVDKLIIKLVNKTKNILDDFLKNYKFYCKNIQCQKVIDFTDNTLFDGFSSSTPCIIENGSDFLLITRHHNYKINDDGSYSNGDKITSNYSITITDKLLNKKSTVKISEPPLTNLKYIGIEDVKFFNFNGEIRFMGTVQNPETMHLAIAFGKRSVNASTSALKYKCIASPNNRGCEKNWAFFSEDDTTLKIVYEWNNFQTYTVDDNHLVNPQTSQSTPDFFKHLRGSSNGYKSGECIWFVCHLVSFEHRRLYYHVIVIYNYKTGKFSYTVPFKFEGFPVEYALGIVVKDKTVLLSYSTNDNTSKVAVIEKTEICKMLV